MKISPWWNAAAAMLCLASLIKNVIIREYCWLPALAIVLILNAAAAFKGLRK